MKIKSMLMGALALGCACAFGEEAKELGAKAVTPGAAARKLQTCDFLLNKDFKKDAKYYLCLFSASWCGPCRAEMPRIAKTYAETLKGDPNIELIHFSRDREEDKALAWAKEHDVKFPVVKCSGGNPLNLHTRGIPHLFIVDADGRLLEDGHPVRLFTNEKLNALKAGTYAVPETATEKTRKAIAKLFPGWSLDTEVSDHDYAGIQPFHRGKSNVTFVHPKNMETPSVISRTVKLSGNNPCLSLCVASWNDDADFLLSVRVNGKDALANRIVCTPDAVPWEDIIVPLSAWRGSTAKIEIVFTANGWWCEFPYLARVDIVEADGDMSINEGKWEVDGYIWSYRAQNGEATIVAGNDGRFSAVSPCPVGSITIPATLAGAKVTHIGRAAFLDCSTMTSVTVPEGVLRIGREAFRDCTGLKSIKIPSSVKIIERDAFAGCNGLSSVSIPEGITSIDRGAFYWCCGLESIEIPSSVTHIGRDAFSFCLGLPSVTIPENVTDVGPQAFRVCKALASVTIPASVTNIDSTAFCDTGALTSFHVAPGNRFYKSENGLILTKDGTTLVRGVNGDAAIPSSVTAIGTCAFEGCVALRSTVIPPGVKSIGPFAFKQCRGMKSVTIPSSVTDIGHEAFSNCKGLKAIAIPQSVMVIRNSTFSCSALTEVIIPTNVKVLERGAFSWCGELKSVTFPEGMTSIGRDAFYNCGKLTSLTIPSSVQKIEQGAFYGCGSLTSVTMRGERPDAPNNIFERCGRLKSIHVPANAKSWAGMKKWQGISLVFDGAAEMGRSDSAQVSANVLTGPYGIRMQPDPGCEKGAEYVLKKLVDDYLPVAVRYYGNPFGGKEPSRVYTLYVKRNDGKGGSGYTGPSWGGRGDWKKQFTIGLAKGSDKWDMDLALVANNVLCVCSEDVGFSLYVNDFIRGDVKGVDPVPEIKEMIRKGLAKDGDENKDRRLGIWREHAPMWSVFEELRVKHPNFMLDYCNLKNSRYAEGKLPPKLSFDQMADLLGEVTGENMVELIKKYGAGRRESQKYPSPKISVAQVLQSCDFLLNKDFKKDAKYYLCLFSASWCGPCRAEMPRIAKTYAETLKGNPNVELIHFSRDQNDEKALAWAKEHDVKFPVVKPNGGNPLDLHARGIPHLFIVKSDGTLVEKGHPMKLFTDEKLRELMQ